MKKWEQCLKADEVDSWVHITAVAEDTSISYWVNGIKIRMVEE